MKKINRPKNEELVHRGVTRHLAFYIKKADEKKEVHYP